MKEEFKPSEHQQNIYDFIENGTQNGVVSAVAGSGKTTTLVHAIDKIPLNKSILFMAFNKSIATELSNRITPQPNITIKTVHAFGMNLIVNQLPFKEQQTSKYKSLLRTILANKPLNEYNLNTTQYEWVNELRIDEEKRTQIENIIEYVNIIGDLTDLGRMNFINITDPIKGVEEICNIAKHHGITTCNQECTSAWYLIKLGSSITSIIDFTDMVYLPLIHNLEIPKYDFVFIDEVQDINACQRQMMLECIESNGGRFIAVGDEHQAIYGFSGADADSFNKLRNIPNTIELPLSVSYRCATSIIDMVKSFVSHILPKDNAIKGSFNANKSYNDVRDGDMVLCRQTFPLVSLCLKYLSMGVKAYVNGSDIGKTLSKMIMDSKQDSNWNMQYVYSYLYAEREKLVQNAITKENLSRGEAFETTSVRNHTEKIQVIELLGKDTTNPQDVIDKINKIFSDDDKSGIMLSTIHKAKGLESENVFIIHGELMPSKHATKPWEITQEQNLRYVAYTRAKSHLAFITDFDAFKAHTSQENNVKPITQSKHIGKVGQRIILTAEIFNLKPITKSNGSSTTLIEMKDSSGNIFTKFGDINTKYIISHHKVLTKGAKVKITGEIKDHSEFRGVKSTLINIPPKFN